MGVRGGPLSDDAQDFEGVWRVAGARASGPIDRVGAATILGDDPVATAAAALGIARTQAQHRRVFLVDLLGDGSPLSPLVLGDDPHGVSDMVHYGVSLRRASHMMPGTPNLFLIPGGAESPLTEEVLGAPLWAKLFEQVKVNDGLVLVAAPALVPSIGLVASQGEGVVLVGEGVVSPPGSPVLAEVHLPVVRPTPPRGNAPVATSRTAPPRAVPRGEAVAPRRRSLAPYLLIIVLAIGGALLFPRLQRFQPSATPTRAESAAGGQPTAGPTVETPTTESEGAAPTGSAGFAVQLYFLNSEQDARATLARSSDSLPATTYAVVRQPGDSADWYRLIAGAFPDSLAAESFLGFMRDRGVLSTGAGRVVRAPFALLLDSAQSDGMAVVRRSAYQGRGIPAYVLRDGSGVWRIYAGAFASPNEGERLKRHLDSLNIQSVLVTRTGSGL